MMTVLKYGSLLLALIGLLLFVYGGMKLARVEQSAHPSSIQVDIPGARAETIDTDPRQRALGFAGVGGVTLLMGIVGSIYAVVRRRRYPVEHR